MSQYLIDQIKETPKIQVWAHASVVEVHGERHLKEISVLCSDTGKTERVPANSVFIFIGALPQTDWLAGVVERDDRGFLLTGPALIADGQRPKGWTLERDPYLLENERARHFCRGRRAARIGEARGFGRRRRLGSRAVHSPVFEQSAVSSARFSLRGLVGAPRNTVACERSSLKPALFFHS